MKETAYTAACLAVISSLLLLVIVTFIARGKKESMTVIDKWSEVRDGRRIYCVLIISPTRGERTVIVNENAYTRAQFGTELN